MQQPESARQAVICSKVRSTVNPFKETCFFLLIKKKNEDSRPVLNLPGMASSLSSVPPVNPNPRPDTIGTFNPHAARAGANT